jgi:co-chaperonin GroES (HSP10)
MSMVSDGACMNSMKTKFLVFALFVTVGALSGSAMPANEPPPQGTPAGSDAARHIGAIKTIAGNTITLTPDSGAEIEVTVQSATHIVRIAPGEKNLKNATPVQLQDLQVGDRILVAGGASDDAKAVNATSIIVMKRSDVEARKEGDRQDWQKRGLGGLVKAVDPTAGTATISVTGAGGAKSVVIHASKDTVIRRYAPDSMKFDDARPSSLQEIQPGDQLRARGDRSADGTELTAQEIVTGSFRNVAGIVNSIDAGAGTINVQDLLTKKPVTIKVTPESQLHQLPPEFAQRIAMRLKAAMAGGAASSDGSAKSSGNAPANGGGAPSGGPSSGGGMRSGGAPDFQQMLSRMPTVALTDLHKGDAVLIVATQGTSAGGATAITLLSGVEAILQAAPSGSQAMMLSPWSLGAPGGGDALGQ